MIKYLLTATLWGIEMFKIKGERHPDEKKGK
jgi:hypothetical protein